MGMTLEMWHPALGGREREFRERGRERERESRIERGVSPREREP